MAKTVQQGDCLIWTGAKFTSGYGAFQINGKTVRAHRHAYLNAAGPIPVGMFVCHRCDTPACVNPDHLFIGSARDNARDRQAKGRSNTPKGEGHGRSKLTRKQVMAIRKCSGSNAEIAKKFGIASANVSRIRNRRLWVGVP